jgi:hypothetical protein
LKDNYKKESGKALSCKVLAENSDVETLSQNNRQKLTVIRVFKLE